MRKVVVTGIGIISPLGVGVEHNWSRLINGKSGIVQITQFSTEDLRCKVGGLIPRGSAPGEFNLDEWFSPRNQKTVEPFVKYADVAARMAVADSGWQRDASEDPARFGLIIGSGIGGLEGIDRNSKNLHERGARKVSPFFVPGSIINQATGYVSKELQLLGPNASVVTACASGTNAIGDAARIIRSGDADVMLAGGTEGAVCRLGLAGFGAIRALSTGFNDDPTAASRPWDKDRDGFVMGEGAAMLVLEEYEYARKRNANIYASVAGYGLSSDGYHMTAPDPSGAGAIRAMTMAVNNAGINRSDVSYVNAHATATPVGDDIELQAVAKFLGPDASNTLMSSTKGATGHLLGGAGAVEAVYGLLAIKHQVVPPTLNLENPSMAGLIDRVPLQAREVNGQTAIRNFLTNSFGFGGVNACLVFTAV